MRPLGEGVCQDLRELPYWSTRTFAPRGLGGEERRRRVEGAEVAPRRALRRPVQPGSASSVASLSASGGSSNPAFVNGLPRRRQPPRREEHHRDAHPDCLHRISFAWAPPGAPQRPRETRDGGRACSGPDGPTAPCSFRGRPARDRGRRSARVTISRASSRYLHERVREAHLLRGLAVGFERRGLATRRAARGRGTWRRSGGGGVKRNSRPRRPLPRSSSPRGDHDGTSWPGSGRRCRRRGRSLGRAARSAATWAL